MRAAYKTQTKQNNVILRKKNVETATRIQKQRNQNTEVQLRECGLSKQNPGHHREVVGTRHEIKKRKK